MVDTGLDYFIRDQIKTGESVKQNNNIHFDGPNGTSVPATLAVGAESNQRRLRLRC